MRRLSLFAVVMALVLAGTATWIAATSQMNIPSPVSARVDPLQLMETKVSAYRTSGRLFPGLRVSESGWGSSNARSQRISLRQAGAPQGSYFWRNPPVDQKSRSDP